MKIWIDLANSPHVLFFKPIVKEFKRLGHEVVFTARDFAQTVGLAERNGMTGTVIGGNDHAALGAKGRQLVGRAFDLGRFAAGKGIDLAVSHNSYAQIMAARILRIRTVTLMDYEHQPANHLAFRLATKIIVPRAIPPAALARYGARPEKLFRYDGLKEHVYLAGFKPQPGFLAGLGVPEGKIVATVRPPAYSAVYHRFDNPLFSEALDRLRNEPNVFTILAPRSDAESLRDKYAGVNVLVLDRAVDGKDLIYHSDLVISGGGTMNREAAVMGTPAYTIFAGRLGAVDRSLIEEGRLVALFSSDALKKIVLVKKSPNKSSLRSDLAGDIVQNILAPPDQGQERRRGHDT